MRQATSCTNQTAAQTNVVTSIAITMMDCVVNQSVKLFLSAIKLPSAKTPWKMQQQQHPQRHQPSLQSSTSTIAQNQKKVTWIQRQISLSNSTMGITSSTITVICLPKQLWHARPFRYPLHLCSNVQYHRHRLPRAPRLATIAPLYPSLRQHCWCWWKRSSVTLPPQSSARILKRTSQWDLTLSHQHQSHYWRFYSL